MGPCPYIHVKLILVNFNLCSSTFMKIWSRHNVTSLDLCKLMSLNAMLISFQQTLNLFTFFVHKEKPHQAHTIKNYLFTFVCCGFQCNLFVLVVYIVDYIYLHVFLCKDCLGQLCKLCTSKSTKIANDERKAF